MSDDSQPPSERPTPRRQARARPPGRPPARPAAAPGWSPGFVEDSGESAKGLARWIAGPLQRGIFCGAARLGKPRWIIEAWRCTTCGHLDLDARSTT